MLFKSGNLDFVFPSATLTHGACVTYLKAALIGTGCMVFNPANLKKLDQKTWPKLDDCAWDPGLLKLVEQRAKHEPGFDLTNEILPAFPPSHMKPVTTRDVLEMFDLFFYELRYPDELKDLFGIGKTDYLVLDAIEAEIRPFLPAIH
jgi:hypothetical protein